jgi:hypothetical protein
MDDLRQKLVEIALAWQDRFGIAPHITSAISEYDAACLIGCAEDDYCRQMRTATAVRKGFDFTHGGQRYQIKANRPSGKPGSFVTLVSKPKNYEWDVLIWLLYNRRYELEEAWLWEVGPYRTAFENQKRLSPADMRRGKRLR